MKPPFHAFHPGILRGIFRLDHYVRSTHVGLERRSGSRALTFGRIRRVVLRLRLSLRVCTSDEPNEPRQWGVHMCVGGCDTVCRAGACTHACTHARGSGAGNGKLRQGGAVA